MMLDLRCLCWSEGTQYNRVGRRASHRTQREKRLPINSLYRFSFSLYQFNLSFSFFSDFFRSFSWLIGGLHWMESIRKMLSEFCKRDLQKSSELISVLWYRHPIRGNWRCAALQALQAYAERMQIKHTKSIFNSTNVVPECSCSLQ